MWTKVRQPRNGQIMDVWVYKFEPTTFEAILYQEDIGSGKDWTLDIDNNYKGEESAIFLAKIPDSPDIVSVFCEAENTIRAACLQLLEGLGRKFPH